MTERTLLYLFFFTEKILTLIFSFEGCNVCNVQYTFKRLNKIHRNVNIGSGFPLTMNHTSLLAKCIHFIGDFGLMFILQAFMWVTYVMQ